MIKVDYLKTDAERLAGEHCSWLMPFIERIYKDAFEHGYGHGWEDCTNLHIGKCWEDWNVKCKHRG